MAIETSRNTPTETDLQSISLAWSQFASQLQSKAEHGIRDQDSDPIMSYRSEKVGVAVLTGLKRWSGVSGRVELDPISRELSFQFTGD